MRFVIQKVAEASVHVEGKLIASIKKGLLVLVGIHQDDLEKSIEPMLQKLFMMRIFEDQEQKMNLSIQDVKGAVLFVSQFTLYADCKKGNRPSFIQAAPFTKALDMFDQLVEAAKQFGTKNAIKIEKGAFGEYMQVALINDGPVTIVLDS